jgi:hypothetical protein
VCEVLGLEGTWGVDLPQLETRLAPLPVPLPVKLLVIEAKLLGDEGHEGTIVALCERAALIHTDAPLAELTDLRLVLADGAHAYAKLVEARDDGFVLRSTLISAAAAAILRRARTA